MWPAGPGRATRARVRSVSSALVFCFGPAASGRAGAAAPPPGLLLAASQLSSDGEASAAGSPAPPTAGPLTLPGRRARGRPAGRERLSAAKDSGRPGPQKGRESRRVFLIRLNYCRFPPVKSSCPNP